jgi:hypothetical protein
VGNVKKAGVFPHRIVFGNYALCVLHGEQVPGKRNYFSAVPLVPLIKGGFLFHIKLLLEKPTPRPAVFPAGTSGGFVFARLFFQFYLSPYVLRFLSQPPKPYLLNALLAVHIHAGGKRIFILVVHSNFNRYLVGKGGYSVLAPDILGIIVAF